ncbi:uncharacterized protein PAE49_005846 isoform 2-T2 [Odontesthes bonariensis]
MKAAIMMSNGVFRSCVFSLAVVYVGSNSEVKEITQFTSCCGSPKVPFQPSCENTWTANDTTFGHTKGNSKTCRPPCKNIEGSRMTLDACINVNLSSVCTNMGVTKESTTVYLSRECQYSPSFGMPHGGQGSLYLLVALMIGWYLMVE